AYTRILKTGLNADSMELIITVIAGVFGTLLFFFSLSSFFIHIVQKNKKYYLKDINIFVLRQINNKINTNFLSMTIICLMLFLTISLIFTAFDLKGTIDKNSAKNLPFDASAFLVADQDEEPAVNDIEVYLNNIDFTFEPYEKHAFFDEYLLDLTIEDLLSKYLSEQEQIAIQENYLYGPVSAIKISDYNAIINLKGQEAVALKDDEVLIVSSYGEMIQALPEYMKNEENIVIEDKA